ncbi:MAG: type II secretion system F family protein [Lachnospiraceae bacterium]|nr:type II secretion system F family protein [Lachnospiraceae bacterium]
MDQKKRTGAHKKAVAEGLRSRGRLHYVAGVKDYLIVVLESAGLAVLIAYGFFDSLYGLLVIIPVGIVNCFRYMKKQSEARQERIRQEFKEILLSVASLLQTGYSVENAFYDSADVLKNLYGQKSILIPDLVEMNREVKMHVPVEKAFLSIVEKYPIEEIESFGEIFLYTKRLGGGYAKYLRDTADRLEERINMRGELSSMISQKKLELSIMSVMPMVIILYMKLSSRGFLAPLYHNVAGVVLMSGSLLIYAGSVAFGDHIIDKVMNSL